MSSVEPHPIGIVGTGMMGTPIARRFLRFGFPTLVYDIDSMRVAELVHAGALAADGLPTLGATCAAVLLSLPTSKAVRDVVLGSEGLAKTCTTGSLVINLSTIPPDLSLVIHEQLAEHSVGFVDAPVSGGRERAQSGDLTVMVSGIDRDKQLALPLLKILGSTIECGFIPASQIIKMINQILVASQYLAVVDALRLADKSNLNADTLDQVISQSLGHSSVWNLAMKTVREHQSGVQARILVKDMLIAKEYATKLGIELTTLVPVLEFLRSVENPDHDPVTALAQKHV